MVVSVVFKGNFESKEYHYLAGNHNVEILDEVLVPVGEYGHIEVGTVVAMWTDKVHHHYTECMPLKHLKQIIAIADRDKLIKQMDREVSAIQAKYNKLLSKLH